MRISQLLITAAALSISSVALAGGSLLPRASIEFIPPANTPINAMSGSQPWETKNHVIVKKDKDSPVKYSIHPQIDGTVVNLFLMGEAPSKTYTLRLTPMNDVDGGRSVQVTRSAFEPVSTDWCVEPVGEIEIRLMGKPMKAGECVSLFRH